MFDLKSTLCALVIAGSLLPTVAAQAATYYVARTGSDANTCVQAQTASTPKLTLPAGVACLVGGDTLIVKAGTYSNQEIKNPPAGSASAYTIIKADPSGARPVLKPNGAALQRGFYCGEGSSSHHIEFRGFEVDGAYNSFALQGTDETGYPHHIRIINNKFHDTVHTGALISFSPSGFVGGNHVIQGNEFYRTGVGNPGYGPGHNTIYGTGSETVIERNTFHNLANGIGIWSEGKVARNVTIRNNIFYDIGRSNTDTWQQGNGSHGAIHVSIPGGGHQIYNNIIYRSGDESRFIGIKIRTANAGDTNYIYNNTIYDIKHASAHAIWVQATDGTHLVKNNIVYLGGAGILGGTQSNNLTTDPSFEDAASADFRIRDGSPATDKGVTAVQVTADIAGVRRPQGAGYDIGAYEAALGGGDLVPPLPPTSLTAQ